MKLKRFTILMIMFIAAFAIVGCDFFLTTNTSTTASEVDTTTLLTLVNGTIDIDYEDYQNYPIYHSDTYDLTDVDDYNDVLFETQSYIKHATVKVLTTLWIPRSNPFNTDTSQYTVGTVTGSGFVFLEEDGYYYFATNYHVIDPSEYNVYYKVMVFEDTTKFYDAELIAADSSLDLAVLRFEKGDFEEITILNIYERLFYQYVPGELVLTSGNPKSILFNVTFGEFLAMEDIGNVDFTVIYHNAQIYEGSSGGALVDIDGNLLGINSWGIETAEAYSYAIPNYIFYNFLINNGILEA